MFKYLLVLAFAPAIFAEWYHECPEYPDLKPLSAYSDKCDETGCILTSTQNLDFSVEFTAPNDVQYFNPSGRLVFRGPDQYELYEPIYFPAEIADGCANLVDAECPLQAGNTYNWHVNWSWHREYMTEDIEYGVEARLYDNYEQVFACMRLLVKYSA